MFSQTNTYQQRVFTDSINKLLDLAKTNINANNFESALNFSTQAVDLTYNIEDKSLKSEAYACLGNSYLIAEDYANSEKYFKLALGFAKSSKNNFTRVAALNGLGNVQSTHYNNIDKAIYYFEEASKYTKKLNSHSSIFINAMNMASMYTEYNKSTKALEYLKIGEEHYQKLEEIPSVYSLTLFVNYADHYKQIKQYDTALEYYDKALDIAQKNQFYNDIINISHAKCDIFEAQGQLDKALEQLRFIQKNKSIFVEAEAQKQINQINANFKLKEFEQELLVSKYQAELAEANYKNTLIIVLSVLTAIIIVFFFFYRYKSNKKKRELKAKNAALKIEKNKAEKATQLKSELISNISHELRTPLHGVIGITSMLMEDEEVNSKHSSLLQSLQFSGDHLKNLVNNILRISDIQSENIVLQKTNVNLYTLINNIIDSLKFQAEEKGNTLELTIPKSLNKLYYTDGFRLSEILINIIGNSIKFTSNGRIKVHIIKEQIDQNSETLLFKISDTGIGIPLEKQELIFENFKQAVKDENTSYGAGLGLPIAKYLLEKMDSKIRLSSIEHHGTVISFRIAFEVSNQQAKELQFEQNLKPLKVLVVEDNKINQMVTQKLILSIGHDCKIAKNGLEAVKACEEDNFDLILMDLNMPIMNGFEATEKIKTIKPNTKIVALTALEISEVKQRCFDLGMDSIINKPISKSQLAEIIEIKTVQQVC
ncbi:signal transduction histidine kinase [Olleya aquimaris]|uniref:histidine kinase n=1 Tax=Olleya aquimaris TaxID=639310 RepID=A0A327R6Z5_9FLAO|nr:signal transduction histidine kinase [Olleya aquimaris]